MEDPQDLRERVIGALGAVLAVALVIGAVAGVAAYGAVRASGLGGGDVAAASTSPSSSPSPTGTANPSASPTPSPSASPILRPVHHSTPKPRKKVRHHHVRPRGALTLAAGERHVSPMGRIDLRGRYPGHGGTRLVVQRLQGGRWSRFPVSVTVRGGTFHTWVASGHRGPNRFRVVDPAGRRASAPVTVLIG